MGSENNAEPTLKRPPSFDSSSGSGGFGRGCLLSCKKRANTLRQEKTIGRVKLEAGKTMREISDADSFLNWANESADCEPAAIEDIDLTSHTQLICQKRFPNSIFLSCDLEPVAAGHVVQTGGVVIPDLAGFQFTVHRKSLYSVAELFDGFDPDDEDGYKKIYDYQVYEQYVEQGESPKFINISLARRLHDHSITDALEEQLSDIKEVDGKEVITKRKVVAVMGGHGMERQDEFYAKVARVSRQLTNAGFLMVSGGGPGAMEATHLGDYFASRSIHDLEAAIEIIKKRPDGALPGKEYKDKDWLQRAWRALETFPIPDGTHEKCKSIGIPTWLYGHEPPAPFATHIAKYFANSVREDGLLAIATHGVIFAPGSAGTTQEVFQDAAQNHYASQFVYSPMIMFGEQHWTEVRPVWQLLSTVARDRCTAN